MYPKYTSEVTKEKYDAIIIGSGIGGLTTASILAKFGKKVLVLERHYVPGGFSHTFKRKDGLVLIDNLLKTGDRIITSDVFPAVNGMDVTPLLDEITTNQMNEWLGAQQ